MSYSIGYILCLAAGAIVGVELYKLVRGERQSTGGVSVIPFTVGIIVGRWGCLFGGIADDTHGTPSGLPGRSISATTFRVIRSKSTNR